MEDRDEQESSLAPFAHLLPQWSQQPRDLQAICSGFCPLGLVVGILGSGKSSLASEFLDSLEPVVKTARIKGAPGVKFADIIDAVAVGFDVSLTIEGNSNTDLTVPDILLQGLQQSERKQVLVVDDAHRLSTEALNGLIGMVLAQDEQAIALHVLLFGEPKLQSRINSLLGYESAKKVPVKILHALTLEETQEYLTRYLNKIGYRKPLTSADFSRIHRLSGGVPGRINRVAEQVLGFDATQLARRPSTDCAKPADISIDLSHLFKKRVVQGLQGGGFQMNSLQAVAFYEGRERVASTRFYRLLLGLCILGAISLFSLINSPVNRPRQNMQVQPVAVVSPPVIQPQAAQPVPTQPTQALPQSQPLTQAAVAVLPAAPAPKPQVAVSKPLPTPRPAAVKKPFYAIQVLGARYARSLQRFLEDQQLVQAMKQAHLSGELLQQQRDGKPWHVLLLGRFDSFHQAKQALDQLPPALKKTHPWIRKMM